MERDETAKGRWRGMRSLWVMGRRPRGARRVEDEIERMSDDDVLGMYAMRVGRRAVFLDRDGTLIVDHGYLRDPGEVLLLTGVAEALYDLKRFGFSLVLVSNQSGIGRGIITEEQANQVHRRLISCLNACGITLDGAYYCPHSPWQGCSCRKPSPGMLIKAATELTLDLARSFMIGDRPTDVEAGRRAGCRSILLMPQAPPGTSPGGDDCHAQGWSEVIGLILNGQEDGR